MFKIIFRKIGRALGQPSRVVRKYEDINPEDVFLDSTNLPGFQDHALEGRIERPMGSATFTGIKVVLGIIFLLLIGKLWFLSVLSGSMYAEISEQNRLDKTLIFADRGAILDRNGLELATNAIKSEADFAARRYAPYQGLAHIVGYIKYPLKDKSGFYYEGFQAKDGVELAYDSILRGEPGAKLIETDVSGTVTSQSVVENPVNGETITLSVDALITQELYRGIELRAKSSGFVGGAGVIMDVRTGEILALTSFPEYDQNVLTSGIDQRSFTSLINDPGKPFLNRAIGGLYTPGSIVKPIVALAALNENLISPNKEILSTGSISVPNPYDPSKPSVFGDWKAHGYTDMRKALAVSSDTYFYSIGGGFGDQRGLGIGLLDKYFNLFAIDEKTDIELLGEVGGVIPSPEWKKEKFDGDIWRLGDTYITSIGQYGTQVTPMSVVRFTAALANKGKLLKPSLLKGGLSDRVANTIIFEEKDWQVVHEGMREAVVYGTSVGVNVPYVSAAGKTGTAEIGAGKKYVNSWSIGFFPYENPRYAWVVLMEKGPVTNTIGATSVMRNLFDWMSINAPEYFPEK